MASRKFTRKSRQSAGQCPCAAGKIFGGRRRRANTKRKSRR